MIVTYYYCMFCENEYETARQVKGLRWDTEGNQKKLKLVDADSAEDSHLCNRCVERLKEALQD